MKSDFDTITLLGDNLITGLFKHQNKQLQLDGRLFEYFKEIRIRKQASREKICRYVSKLGEQTETLISPSIDACAVEWMKHYI